jgi:iron complex transport system ATP-binding protein
VSEVVIEARGLLRAAGGRRLVGPVDLSIARGEAVALVGPNGAGKTTLLRLLAGIVEPTAGTVALAGTALSGMARREVARRVVYLPQHPPVAVPLSVERYLQLARYPHRQGWRDDDPAGAELVIRALAEHRLEALRDRKLGDLSGGERQLVQLVAAEIQGGDVWLVDEPTTHLDPAHQREVARHLAALPREPAAAPGRPPHTLVVATHDLNLALALATRVVALAGGRVVADGTPGDVLAPRSLEGLYGAPFATTGSGAARRVWLEL